MNNDTQLTDKFIDKHKLHKFSLKRVASLFHLSSTLPHVRYD